MKYLKLKKDKQEKNHVQISSLNYVFNCYMLHSKVFSPGKSFDGATLWFQRCSTGFLYVQDASYYIYTTLCFSDAMTMKI